MSAAVLCDEAGAGNKEAQGDKGRGYQTVAATGSGQSAGLTFFEPEIAPRKRRKLDIDSSCGVWSLSLAVRHPGTAAAHHNFVFASGQTSSELCSLGGDGTSVVLEGRTIQATTLPGGKWIVRVLEGGVQVLDLEGNVRQFVGRPAVEGDDDDEEEEEEEQQQQQQHSITHASLTDEYAVLLWTDGRVQFVTFDDEARVVQSRMVGNGLGAYLSATVVKDEAGVLRYESESEGYGGVGTSSGPTKMSTSASAPASASGSGAGVGIGSLSKQPHTNANANTNQANANTYADDEDEIDYGDDADAEADADADADMADAHPPHVDAASSAGRGANRGGAGVNGRVDGGLARREGGKGEERSWLVLVTSGGQVEVSLVLFLFLFFSCSFLVLFLFGSVRFAA